VLAVRLCRLDSSRNETLSRTDSALVAFYFRLCARMDKPRSWLAGDGKTELLVLDPKFESAEHRRLATLPAGHAQGYAQRFEAFVAQTYATIREETRDGLPTFDDGLRSPCFVDAVLKSSGKASWTPIEH
jgi:hypothetical protein